MAKKKDRKSKKGDDDHRYRYKKSGQLRSGFYEEELQPCGVRGWPRHGSWSWRLSC